MSSKDKVSLAVHLVLDESGSMLRHHAATIKAVNTLLAKLALSLAPATVTVSVFGVRFATIIEKEPVYNLPTLTSEKYRPNGGTPTFRAAETAIADLDETDADFKVMIMLTDGDAGDMRRGPNVRKLVHERQAAGNWLFIYLGAKQDAQDMAEKLGVLPEHAIDYSIGMMEEAMDAAAEAALMFGSSGKAADAGFTKAKRKEVA